MHPIERIRREVFEMTQASFAEVAGVTQATVSRWERGEFEPSRDELSRIRDEARRKRLKWRDAWFFERPPEAAQ